MLTDYEQRIFTSLESLDWYKWFRIDPNRPDLKDFMATLKKRIDIYNDFEFNGAYTRMQRIETLEQTNDSDYQWMRMDKVLIDISAELVIERRKPEYVWPEPYGLKKK